MSNQRQINIVTCMICCIKYLIVSVMISKVKIVLSIFITCHKIINKNSLYSTLTLKLTKLKILTLDEYIHKFII